MNETKWNGGVIERSQSALVKSPSSSAPPSVNSQHSSPSSAYSSTTSSSTMSSDIILSSRSARERSGMKNENMVVCTTRSGVATSASKNTKKPTGVSLERGLGKSNGFPDDSDEFCDTPRQRYSMIDDFPDLIKDSSGECVGEVSRKRFLSRGLTRLFRRATMLSSSSSSGLYKVTSFDGGGGKSYSESNLSRIHLGLPDSASSTLTRVKTSKGIIPENNNITTRNVQVRFAKRVRPASMYTSSTLSSSIYSTGKTTEDQREGEKFNKEVEMKEPGKDIGFGIKSSEENKAEQPQNQKHNVALSKKKGPESWVVVHKLKSQSDGGILDPDDKLVDVADDREQIMAIYEEDNDGMGLPSLQHNAGDGTSASSVGTNSPDIFQASDHKFQPFARTDIEITGEELTNGVGSAGTANGGGLTLQVRRGSEPALNRLSPVHLSPPDPSKRWSAAPKIDEDKDDQKEFAGSGEQDRVNASTHSANSVVSVSVGDNVPRPPTNGAPPEGGSGLFQKHSKYSSNNAAYGSSGGGGVNAQIQHRNNQAGNSSKYGTISTSDVERREGGSRFSRDHHRLSMQFVGDGGYKWADAADRALSLSLRKEPLGANATPDTPLENLAPQHFSTPNTEHPPNSDMLNGNVYDDTIKRTMEILFKHEAGPLGIHVVPEHNADARNQGLIVQSVEPGGRIDRDGRVQAHDKIIEINGKCLIGVQFQKAQELFREGLKTPELRLKVIKHPLNLHTSSPTTTDLYSEESEKENMIEGHERIVGDSKVATVSQTKKLPLQQSSSTLPRPGAVTTNLIASNTRKIGRKYEIDLQKGPQGLGFSITTRDNPAGGNCPIYIKNILPTGAAIEDGRLRPGDRLLEVNGIEITGKTQSEAVSILRNIPQGGIVKLVVSRQERVDLSPKLPRQIPPDKLEEDSQPTPWSEREVLTLDIPVLDTEKAGLGISVKGKTNAVRGKMMDMGIFIKSVIHGGAASRDGRLKSNDQLLNINGVSLLNRSNTDAMETLRRTMTQDGGPKPKPGFITLTIARRVPSSSAPTTDLSGGGSSASGDETDSWSKNISMSVDGSRNEDKSVTIESLNRSVDSNGNAGDEQNAIFVQQLPNESPRRAAGSTTPTSRHSYHNQNHHVRSSSLRRMDDRSPIKTETEAKVRHRSPPPYFLNSSVSSNTSNKVGVDLPRNPVLDRLTGKSSSSLSNPSRNDSYYKATNDTWNGAFLQSVNPSRISNEMLESGGGMMMGNHHVAAAVTVHNARGEMVLVEDDYVAPQKPPRRSRSSTPVDGLEAASGQKQGSSSRVSTPVSSAPNANNNGQPPSDVTYASQTSLEELGGFSRDAFGRQSMSEKRHATLDAKSTDTYQRNKKLRDERQRQKAHEEAQAEQLARERNMQDQLARRGIKRPFSSSTEDELALRASQSQVTTTATTASQTQSHHTQGSAVTSPTGNGTADGITLGHRKEQPVPPTYQPRFSKYSVIGKRGDRLGLGDQLLQLLHQWGQSRQTPRTDVIGLPRVNSADSLVDSLKQPSNHSQPTPSSTSKGKKSKGGSYKKDIGPSLGMKKSSSLESLQTMVQEIQIQEDLKSGFVPGRAGPPSVRVVRGRGCNESFRQAVDRSYEAPLGELANQMETLAEEETESCISGNAYGRKAADPADPDAEGPYGKTKGAKKKQGIFRGLGSMFRFGRHRKSTGATSSAAAAAAALARAQQQQEEAVAAARFHEELLESQHNLEQQRSRQEHQRKQHHPDYVHAQSLHGSANYQTPQGYPYPQHPHHGQQSNMRVPMPQSSSGKSGRKSEGSNRTEKDINGNTNNSNHGRSTSFDVYNEMQRPGSRMGIVDPKKYTHYINYEEIRHHLNDNNYISSQSASTKTANAAPSTSSTSSNNKNDNGSKIISSNIANGNNNNNGLSEAQLRQMRLTVVEQRKKAILESRRHQQHYHSQRREHPRERQERPVSNFYEYESVQAAMHAAHAAAAAAASQSPPGNSNHHHPSAHTPKQQHHHHLQNTNMSPPPPPSQSGLILHGQPIYGMSSAQLQLQQQHQQNRLNNNGITLPSPSGPFTVGMHQTSPSQFQVITTPVVNNPSSRPLSSAATMERGGTLSGSHHATSSIHPHSQYPPAPPLMGQQRPKPNSLPRRSHKADPNLHPLMQSTVSSGPFPQHFPVVPPQPHSAVSNSSSSGRYSMHFPHSHQHSSYAQIPEQSPSTGGSNGVAYRGIPQQQRHQAMSSSSGHGSRAPPPGSVLLHHQSSGIHHGHHHQYSAPSTNVGSKV